MLKGWRGAVVASLATALILLAIDRPQEGGFGEQNYRSELFASLLSPEMLLVYFTAALVAVGVLTYLTFNRQAEIMAEQIKLARAEFIATHRPKIELLEVDFDDAEILYMLANTGGSEATIKESWILVETHVAGQDVRNLRSFGHDDLGQMRFAPGEIKDLSVPAGVAGFHIHFPETNHIVGEDGRVFGGVYFAGAILYSDSLGNLRRSVFRRRWYYDRQGFYRTDDPDHEYAA